MPAKYRTYKVQGGLQASLAADLLIHKSKWFQCTPLPDDWYEFQVKDEAGSALCFDS